MESPVLHVNDGDHRACCLVHDPVDQLQGLGGPLVHDHQGNIWALGRRDASDVGEGGLSGDDVVAQSGHRASDLVESDPWPIGDQDPQANNVFGVHRASIERVGSLAILAAAILFTSERGSLVREP